MSDTVADFLVGRLREWGVERIYGYPGDGINGILGALNRAGNDPELIQVRHEEMAAFMACAHAKFTGEVGVCLATSGPGAVHLLNGLYDAKLDHQPVVAIVGQQARSSLGGSYQQEIDLDSLFKDVAHEYVHVAVDPAQVRHLIDRAMRIAKAERTVTCLIVPNDLQDMDAVAEPPRAHGTVHSGIGYSAPRVIPRDDDLRRAAEVLNAGERVAMLVGAGALGAPEEVTQVADLLGRGRRQGAARQGRAARRPALGHRLDRAARHPPELGPDDGLRHAADGRLELPYSEFLPRPGQARGVQVDIDGRMLGIRYPMEVNLVGDSAETLRALVPLLRRKEDRAWREAVEASVADWWDLIERRAMNDGDPINPQRVFHELSSRLPENAIITCDSGSAANWFARDLRMRRGMLASLSGTLATMGPGVPYAIAAKFAHPHRVAVALVGDGAFQMNGMNELITIAKYWRRWADPRLVIMVLHNNDLNQVTWEQRAMEGDPKFAASQDLPDFPYAEYAELVGLRGIRVDRPEDVAGAWDEAFAADRPVVLEAITDPDVPPLPPHVTLEQMKAMTLAMAKGDPDRLGAVTQMVKGKLEEFLPHRGGR